MDWIRLHAAINEAPAAGIAIGAVLLVISAAVGGRNLQKAGLGLFAVASLLASLAFLTGAPAEIALQGAPGMSESLIAEHRYASRIAVALTVLLGFIGVVALSSMKQESRLSRKLMLLSLSLALAAIAATGWGVYSGIRVQNSEIQAKYLPHRKADVKEETPKKETPKKDTPKAPRAIPQT